MTEIETDMNEGKELEINKCITIKEIEDAINKTKNNKAAGPDQITNEMMKEGMNIIKEHLKEILNHLKEDKSEIPQSWELGD